MATRWRRGCNLKKLRSVVGSVRVCEDQEDSEVREANRWRRGCEWMQCVIDLEVV